MSSVYKVISLLAVTLFLVHCSDGKLSGPSITTIPSTTISSTTTSSSSTTTTIISYGACERTQDPRFSVESCESPTKCHVRDMGDGYCRPSCGYLAVLSEDGKYAHYGPDHERNTEDDPHFLARVPCDQLDKWGATDWKKIPLVNNLEPWEVAHAQQEGRTVPECCGSDQQVAKNNGEHEEEDITESEGEENEEDEHIGEDGEYRP